MPERIDVVGVHGGEVVAAAARAAVAAADLLVGAPRHLEAVSPIDLLEELGATDDPLAEVPGRHPQRRLELVGALGPVLDEVAAEPGTVCVLASGDPGFFGIVRLLGERFGPDRLGVHPAPSSVAVAFARLGLPWDDATVVSAHGRSLGAAARAAAASPKVAVLVSPDARPEQLGAALLGAGAPHDRVAVCTRLGTDDEAVVRTDLPGLAAGSWDPLSVVVLLTGDGLAGRPSLAWGRHERAFAHRAGMVTKAEVRAVAIGKLGLPPTGVLWDVGAGSGSVAVECAALAPGLSVHAVERRDDDVARIRGNAVRHGVAVDVVAGEAPAALAHLPDPDRVFIGGGGLTVLDAVLARLRPGGRVVATYAAVDRAVAAAARLGEVVQVAVSRGEPLAGGLRLAAENPVFVVAGPAVPAPGEGATT